jgi:hypothetical protein
MASVSGLSAKNRIKARDLAVNAAMLTYRHREVVHYTQGPQRWSGIDKDLKAYKGEYPKYIDCSAFATWCIWNGLDHFGVRDTVNALNWKAGYTGTMLNHGKRVVHLSNVIRGDCVLYGRPGSTGAHTAIIVGRLKGTPMVVSHGSEAGPFYLPYNYRSDIMSIRRYI